jgi:hypothetical protein
MGKRRVKRAVQDPAAALAIDEEERRRSLRANGWRSETIEYWTHHRRPNTRFGLWAAVAAQRRSGLPETPRGGADGCVRTTSETIPRRS